MNTHPKNRTIFFLGLLLPILALACRAVVPGSSNEPSPSSYVAPTAAAQLSDSVPTPAIMELPASVTDEQGLLVTLYQQVNPSVVNITVYVEEGGSIIAQGRGSGFVYDADGHIITNAHVVQGTKEIDVGFSDGTILTGELVGLDLNSDLAVVKVGALPAGVGPLPLGDFNNIAVGQTVIAIGNPFGLENTLTRGIVSALGRNIPALTQFSIPEAIQTDAAINPGNSGGPLLNLQGEVLGVNAQIETGGLSNGNTGVGFAIPVSIVKKVVPALISEGEYTWPWLGVSGGTVSPTLVKAMNLPVPNGAYLSEVISDGPADKAGLRGSDGTDEVEGRQVEVGGDVIIAIDGQPVTSFDDVLIYVAMQTTPGQEVTLTILRDGEQQDVVVELEPRPVEIQSRSTTPDFPFLPTPSTP